VLGGGFQSEFRPVRGMRMAVNANLNSQNMGQVNIKISSSEHIEIALVSVFSIFKAILDKKMTENKSREVLEMGWVFAVLDWAWFSLFKDGSIVRKLFIYLAGMQIGLPREEKDEELSFAEAVLFFFFFLRCNFPMHLWRRIGSDILFFHFTWKHTTGPPALGW